jgi:hypothetical protein
MDAKVTRLLIAGDSFASGHLSQGQGWPDQLARNCQVTNISRPGIGEYKILQSLQETMLENFDHIIVCHTSPYRLHCETNPLYPNGHIYKGSDVILADAESKADSLPAAKSLMDYFRYIYDPDYQRFVHHYCCKEIDQLTNDYPVTHITFFEWSGFYDFRGNLVNFHKIWNKHPGDICHLDLLGNNRVSQILSTMINSGSQK